MTRKRIFISPLMLIGDIFTQEKVMVPDEKRKEELRKAFCQKDSQIEDFETITINDVMTPKEYGIKKLTKKYKL